VALPANFAGANANLAPGKGTEDRVGHLPCFVSPNGEIIARWKLTDAEKALILERGEVWTSQMTFGNPFQPFLVSGFPLMELKDEGGNIITYDPDAGLEPQKEPT
jgi:hypothetical protein